MTERGNYFIKTWNRSLLFPSLSFSLRHRNMSLMLALQNKRLFFPIESLELKMREAREWYSTLLICCDTLLSVLMKILIWGAFTQLLFFVRGATAVLERSISITAPLLLRRRRPLWLCSAGPGLWGGDERSKRCGAVWARRGSKNGADIEKGPYISYFPPHWYVLRV